MSPEVQFEIKPIAADGGLRVEYRLSNRGAAPVWVRNVHLHPWTGFHDERDILAPSRETTGIFPLDQGRLLLLQGASSPGRIPPAMPQAPIFKELAAGQTTEYVVLLRAPIREWAPSGIKDETDPTTFAAPSLMTELLVGVEIRWSPRNVIASKKHLGLVESLEGGEVGHLVASAVLPSPILVAPKRDSYVARANLDYVARMALSPLPPRFRPHGSG